MSTPEAIASNVQANLHVIAGTFGARAGLKEVFSRLSLHTGLTAGQVKRLWYGEWSVIPAHVFLAVQKSYRKHMERAERQAEHQAAIYRALSTEWDEQWSDTSSYDAQPSPDGAPAAHSAAPSPCGDGLNT
ncbi:hypothetical protein [Komagataeibacter xylinus]|uniref:hypothetical protein n=1 Tax=Komagataeibacter xylinus TaxID=28448 RepID=UPI00280C08EE|nr:hypothetical protein [Komagataeibacter xylinus]